SAVALGLIAATSMVEIALRIPALPWPSELFNYVTSCYEMDSPAPIWYFDPRIALRWPKPHVETRCGTSRLFWNHRTDQLGIRNPEDWHAVDVALLGVSMVYGHGLDETETSAHHLRTRLGKRVANLGRVAGSPVDYLLQVQNVVPLLHARVVVVFLYRNDVE